jgi:hypothetical protein
MNNAYFSGSQCCCQKQCQCAAGQACRCTSSCTCTQTQHPQGAQRAQNWSEASENEMSFQSYRNPWLRARARAMLQRRQLQQRDWRRRTTLNGLFTRRFNWGPRLPQMAGALGVPYMRPDSQRFMFALARWQRSRGLPVTGILTPSVWRSLMANRPAYPGYAPPPDQAAPMSPQASGGWAPPAAAEPPDAASPADDAAIPLTGDAGGNELLPAQESREYRYGAY